MTVLNAMIWMGTVQVSIASNALSRNKSTVTSRIIDIRAIKLVLLFFGGLQKLLINMLVLESERGLNAGRQRVKTDSI